MSPRLEFVPYQRLIEGMHEPPMPRSAALEALEAETRVDPGAVYHFLASHEFPLAEPPLYTFVYRGEADAVRLRHWIQGLPTSQPFHRLERTDLWYRTLELPDASRVEYKIEVIRGGASQWIEDPLNPHIARDPFGANSVVTARGYEVPSWVGDEEGLARGELEDLAIDSEPLGPGRRVTVYRPPAYRDTRRYPLLVVHDGGDYLEYASFRPVLDHLIARHEVPAMIVAFTHPVDRMAEYTADEGHARFIVEELVPRMEETFPLLEGPASRGLVGASLGGVAALHAALAYPGRFGRLLLQSGSFAFTDIGPHGHGPVFDRIVRMMNAFRADPTPPAARVFVSVGVYESLASESRALVPVLRRAGAEVHFVESRDGHNWENWRDRLRDGLSWLFPGPLWMIYE